MNEKREFDITGTETVFEVYTADEADGGKLVYSTKSMAEAKMMAKGRGLFGGNGIIIPKKALILNGNETLVPMTLSPKEAELYKGLSRDEQLVKILEKHNRRERGF